MAEGTPTVITDRDEMLNRQVHPDLLHPVQIITSTAFTPSKSDAGMLSTLREAVAPSEAHRRWTEDLNRKSVGTWGVEVGEANDLDLICLDDACLPESPADHASVDFSASRSKGQLRQLGRKLRDASVARGPLFVPDP
jgi:predicted trehalose synthase